jgi:hypothetical protein
LTILLFAYRHSCKIAQKAQKIKREAEELRNLNPKTIRERISAEENKLIEDGSPLFGVIEKTRKLVERARSLETRLYFRINKNSVPSYMKDAHDHVRRVVQRLEENERGLETYRASIRALFHECRVRASAIEEPLADYLLLKELKELSEDA